MQKKTKNILKRIFRLSSTSMDKPQASIESPKDNLIVISGYFGYRLTGIYEAPLKENCYFFSNNLRMKEPSEKKGWLFIFVENMPITSEPRISSLQSKYVKFLQFDMTTIGWTPGTHILYFDHKFEVKESHVDQIRNLNPSGILIRNTPKEKLTIQDEVDAALLQKRYSEVMPETLNWVNDKIENEGYSENNRIMNTGLILFSDIERTQHLCDAVYETCWLLGQPECQIVWGILAQRYERIITRISWQALDILWKEPDATLE